MGIPNLLGIAGTYQISIQLGFGYFVVCFDVFSSQTSIELNGWGRCEFLYARGKGFFNTCPKLEG